MKKLQNIKKGDIVEVDSNHCYVSYSQFIWRHIKYAIRWAYKCFPYNNYKYQVKGIHKHCMKDRYDDNKYVVVVENTTTKQIFLIGEKGIRKLSEVENE